MASRTSAYLGDIFSADFCTPPMFNLDNNIFLRKASPGAWTLWNQWELCGFPGSACKHSGCDQMSVFAVTTHSCFSSGMWGWGFWSIQLLSKIWTQLSLNKSGSVCSTMVEQASSWQHYSRKPTNLLLLTRTRPWPLRTRKLFICLLLFLNVALEAVFDEADVLGCILAFWCTHCILLWVRSFLPDIELVWCIHVVLQRHIKRPCSQKSVPCLCCEACQCFFKASWTSLVTSCHIMSVL